MPWPHPGFHCQSGDITLHELVICGAALANGSGAPCFAGNLAITAGVITQVGGSACHWSALSLAGRPARGFQAAQLRQG